MERIPSSPTAVSIRGAPVPKIANASFKGIRVRRRRDGTVTISTRSSGSLESRLVGLLQETMPMFWFLVAWTMLVFSVGAAAKFDLRLMFPLGVVGGPAFFMALIKYVHPRLRALPAVGLVMGPSGWQADDVEDGEMLLPRTLAATAQLVPEVDGRSTVAVTSSSGRRHVIASHLQAHDAARLVDVLREYGQSG